MFMIRKRQAGITLIELLIGMLVGLIVVAGGISIYIASVRGQAENIKLARLNQDMRAMMDMMERDIRRAGFVTADPATNFALLQNNPFFDGATSGATTDVAIYNTGSCIVYAYNRDEDPNNDGVLDEAPPAVDANERLGFRLNGNTGELEIRNSGDSNDDCADGEWESVTEPEVEITGVTFTLTAKALNVTSMTDDDHDGIDEPSDHDGILTGDDNHNFTCDAGEACNTCTRDGSPDPACLYVRYVTIKLDGQLRDDNTVKQTITEQVRIRNDKFLDAIP
ncbi:PilW family protein [Methylomicrobium lacus]|uniref:PilW family protein n=1 Tax=Methylomicrobium lacus TaxID=136992 RepID=UPI0035A85985